MLYSLHAFGEILTTLKYESLHNECLSKLNSYHLNLSCNKYFYYI